MDMQEIRRGNLRKWLETHSVPPKEKSYFSQLLSGASFGERAARRLESDYGMGESYLDSGSEATKPVLTLVERIQRAPEQESFNPDDVIELLALFQQSGSKGRSFILKAARNAEKVTNMKWLKVSSDDT
jgi:hypothetical protein